MRPCRPSCKAGQPLDQDTNRKLCTESGKVHGTSAEPGDLPEAFVCHDLREKRCTELYPGLTTGCLGAEVCGLGSGLRVLDFRGVE